MAKRACLSLDNLWRTVRFALDGQEFARRLVTEVRDFAAEIGAGSPVGEVLLWARPGDEIVTRAPGGDVVVKVLEVGDLALV